MNAKPIITVHVDHAALGMVPPLPKAVYVKDRGWSYGGFVEGDNVYVARGKGNLQKGVLRAILGTQLTFPAARVDLDDNNSWEGPFDCLMHAHAFGAS